jgi:hypothetical protein
MTSPGHPGCPGCLWTVWARSAESPAQSPFRNRPCRDRACSPWPWRRPLTCTRHSWSCRSSGQTGSDRPCSTSWPRLARASARCGGGGLFLGGSGGAAGAAVAAGAAALGAGAAAGAIAGCHRGWCGCCGGATIPVLDALVPCAGALLAGAGVVASVLQRPVVPAGAPAGAWAWAPSDKPSAAATAIDFSKFFIGCSRIGVKRREEKRLSRVGDQVRCSATLAPRASLSLVPNNCRRERCVDSTSKSGKFQPAEAGVKRALAHMAAASVWRMPS